MHSHIYIYIYIKKEQNPTMMDKQTSTQTFTPDNTGLKYEKNRLMTFIDWPIADVISPADLAKEGFYYLRRSDHVACGFCQIILQSWTDGDDVKIEHEKYSPKCRRVGNVTLNQSIILDTLKQQQQPPPPPPSSMIIKSKYPNFSHVDHRCDTFTECWPEKATGKSPREMADCGFFYRGISDHVECFYCGIGLRNWQNFDDIWVQHILHSQRTSGGGDVCLFVRLKKDGKFIQKFIIPYSSSDDDGNCFISDKDLQTLLYNYDITKRVLNLTRQNYQSDDIFKFALKQRLAKCNGDLYQHPITFINDLDNLEKKNQILRLQRGEIIINNNDDDDYNICKICHSKPATICFWPCRHLKCCEDCALWSAYFSSCFLCKTPIELVFRVDYQENCQKCLVRKSNVCFFPCGHLQVCDNCARVYVPEAIFPIKCIICHKTSQCNFIIQ